MLIWLLIFGVFTRYLFKMSDVWHKKFSIRNKEDLKITKLFSYTMQGSAVIIIIAVLSTIGYLFYLNSVEWKKTFELKQKSEKNNLDLQDSFFENH